jgi:hypothetical protein
LLGRPRSARTLQALRSYTPREHAARAGCKRAAAERLRGAPGPLRPAGLVRPGYGGEQWNFARPKRHRSVHRPLCELSRLPHGCFASCLARPAEAERAPRWRRAGDLVMPAEHRTATSAQGTGTVLPAACTLARAARQRRRRSSPERAAGCAQGVAARRPGTQPGETPRARGAGRGSWSEIWPSPGASSGQNQILER